MAHANLVHSPLLLMLCEIAEILEEATSRGGARARSVSRDHFGRLSL
jgi:hypothetical protein